MVSVLSRIITGHLAQVVQIGEITVANVTPPAEEWATSALKPAVAGTEFHLLWHSRSRANHLAQPQGLRKICCDSSVTPT